MDNLTAVFVLFPVADSYLLPRFHPQHTADMIHIPSGYDDLMGPDLFL